MARQCKILPVIRARQAASRRAREAIQDLFFEVYAGFAHDVSISNFEALQQFWKRSMELAGEIKMTRKAVTRQEKSRRVRQDKLFPISFENPFGPRDFPSTEEALSRPVVDRNLLSWLSLESQTDQESLECSVELPKHREDDSCQPSPKLKKRRDSLYRAALPPPLAYLPQIQSTCAPNLG
jgi:hypothetical protein